MAEKFGRYKEFNYKKGKDELDADYKAAKEKETRAIKILSIR